MEASQSVPNLTARLFGSTLISDAPLPGLIDGAAASAFGRIHIHQGQAATEGIDGRTALYAPPGMRCLAQLAPEPQLWIESASGEHDRVNWLCASFLPALLASSGALALRGAAVLADAGAVLLMGPAMSGKSTAAANLASAGWPLISDDAVVLSLIQGELRVFPGPPWIKLWPDAVCALGSRDLGPVREGLAKRRIAVAVTGASAHSFPIAGACVLRANDVARYTCESMTSSQLLEIAGVLQRQPAVPPSQAAVRAQFAALCALARIANPHWLSRPESGTIDADQGLALRALLQPGDS